MNITSQSGRHQAPAKSLTRFAAAATVTGSLVAVLTHTGTASAEGQPKAPEAVAVASTPTASEPSASEAAKSLAVTAAAATVAQADSLKKAESVKKAAQPVNKVRASRSSERAQLVAHRTSAVKAAVAQRQPVQVRPAVAERPTPVARGAVRHAITHRGGEQAVRQLKTAQRSQQVTPRVQRIAVRHAVTNRPVTNRPRVATYQAQTESANASARSAMPARHGGAVSIAASLTGIPYVYAGSSMSGVDCSGYVAMVFERMGIDLPHQSGAIRSMTTPVANPQPGDLVFYPGHVAIYAGGGKVYEARHAGTVTGLYPLLPGASFGRL